ncbi:CHAT domain-containing protein [Saccharothrix deserti]|uniref:CHAT domain-containing protein n=1 Tax=Saccharothrix deserti TaxID=2593674 RepID=UPI00131A933E|nr:CHAT domain-containing protein [Saccharothrix deserti]
MAETCFLIGLLHWSRGTAFADERARLEAHTAIAFLFIAHEAGVPLPEPLPRIVASTPLPPIDGVSAHDSTVWDLLLFVTEPLLGMGADAQGARVLAALFRNAVADAVPDAPSRPLRVSALVGTLRTLFERTNDLAPLEEAIAVCRAELVGAIPDAERAMHEYNLAESLRMMHERTGDVAVLEEAVARQRTVLKIDINEHRRFAPLLGHSVALRRLFDLGGDAALLDEAIESARAAAELATGLDRAKALGNLGSVLADRFDHGGRQETLNEAITVTRRAVKHLPAGTALQVTCRYNLATLLSAQFDRNGDLSALEEAAASVRAALAAMPAGSPENAHYQAALTGYLINQYSRTRDVEVLDEAIRWGRTAVADTPADHPDRAYYVANLLSALRLKAEEADDRDAFDEALVLARDVMRSEVAGRRRGQLLVNVVNVLQMHYVETGEVDSIEEAVAVARRAVAATPADNSDRAVCEHALAGALETAAPVFGSHLEDEATRLLESVADREDARTVLRVRAAWSWGVLAWRAGRLDDALRGFTRAVGLLPRLAARGLVRTDGNHWLAEFSRLTSEAASCALEAGRPEQAVELLETGRGVLLAQTLESRSESAELRDRAPELADRFSDLCALLDADREPSPDEDPDRRRELAAELDALVERVRTIQGLEDFLLPPRIDVLRRAAQDGPIVILTVSRYRSDALIVTSDGVRVRQLPDLTPRSVHERFVAFQAALGRQDDLVPALDTESAVHDVLVWLWDSVTGPVLDMLRPDAGTTPRVWWVPCGLLGLLPLHAAGRHLDPSARHTVMDLVVSSYAPTIRALAHARRRRRAVRVPDTLAVAMPITPRESRLPYTGKEVEAISRVLPSVRTLVGAQATRAAVLSRLPGSQRVHFACHATSDPTDPSGSHLLVHDHEENPLRVLEISRLRLEAPELAFLSACDTAVTSPELADEAVHIASAFLLAGYPHVIGTLWPINDRTAATIAEHVYTTMASHNHDVAHTASSLHEVTLRTRDRYLRMPTRWASHVHVGA